ncbi:thioredoxin-like 1-1, chloroplastic [Neltuma alba]|uniref:thioredoxin-like 1-1, chloroplastic n=1 Tax=Neltuma alba TaxID=207710 RepID=UPI0010A533FC|nr:thioredoxin-like 1-1, chloroplastic [Prosopis alba]
MAEVLGKTSLISSWNSQRHHCRRISVAPKNLNCKSGVSCSLRRSPSLKLKSQVLRSSSSSTQSEFYGRKIVFEVMKSTPYKGISLYRASTAAQMGRVFGNAQKWWEKGLQPNMKEVTSAQDLVDSLLNAGDKLVIVDFFSPGCGGCKALHPKICQFAEMYPNVLFLQVNNEEHRAMSYSLGVHVLPFFRFYRGSQGRLCSFSCTNATIKKFKDALAKHIPDRCSLGPAKGLEEKELLALAANKDLNFTYKPKPIQPVHEPAGQEFPMEPSKLMHVPTLEELVGDDAQPLHAEELAAEADAVKLSDKRTLATAGR